MPVAKCSWAPFTSGDINLWCFFVGRLLKKLHGLRSLRCFNCSSEPWHTDVQTGVHMHTETPAPTHQNRGKINFLSWLLRLVIETLHASRRLRRLCICSALDNYLETYPTPLPHSSWYTLGRAAELPVGLWGQ